MPRKRTHAGATAPVATARSSATAPRSSTPITGQTRLGQQGARTQGQRSTTRRPRRARSATAQTTRSPSATPAATSPSPPCASAGSSRGWEEGVDQRINEQRTRAFCERYADTPAALVTEQRLVRPPRPARRQGPPARRAEGDVQLGGQPRRRARDRSAARSRSDGQDRRQDGNTRKKNPPSEAEIEPLIAAAYAAAPRFGAWLEFACFTGARPGEIDALQVERSERRRIGDPRPPPVVLADDASSRLPKNGQERIDPAQPPREGGDREGPSVLTARRRRRGRAAPQRLHLRQPSRRPLARRRPPVVLEHAPRRR